MCAACTLWEWSDYIFHSVQNSELAKCVSEGSTQMAPTFLESAETSWIICIFHVSLLRNPAPIWKPELDSFWQFLTVSQARWWVWAHELPAEHACQTFDMGRGNRVWHRLLNVLSASECKKRRKFGKANPSPSSLHSSHLFMFASPVSGRGGSRSLAVADWVTWSEGVASSIFVSLGFAFCDCEGTWSKQSPSSNRPDPTVNLNNSPPWQIQYEMWGDVMSKCVHFALRRSVANNVEIHIPVPSDVDSPSFKTSIGTVRYIPDQAANAATRWVLAVQGTVFTCL